MADETAGAGLDDTDRRILAALGRDARATLQDVGAQVGLGRPAVHERIRKLEARGVLKGYHAALDPEAVGAGQVAFVMLELSPAPGKDCLARCGQVAEALRKLPEVLEFHTVAGAEDAVLKVRVRDPRALERLVLRDISGLPGVARVRTLVALSTQFERPLALQDGAPRARRRR